jgi:two-component system CheB/CheR fusion protein
VATQDNDDPTLEALLDYLKRTRNFDFRAYKRTTLTRRIERRMQAVNARDFEAYQDYLQQNDDEFAQLFNTLLINVTAFFRDGTPWDFVASDVIPQILDSKGSHDPIRLWSAGCASGQEAFTLAMLLADVIGIEDFRTRVKIYATDVDDDALAVARHGTYNPKDVAGVPEEMLEKYFERAEGRYAFRKDLRRCIIFGRHDLLQDAPISRVDLIVCRNTLMYFNTSAQTRILARFHFALNDGGFLFLGRAETILSHTNTFAPVDLKRRVFVKVSPQRFHNRLALVGSDDEGQPTAVRSAAVGSEAAREAAFDASGVAQIVLDREGTVILANTHARGLFGLVGSDIGRPFQDLDVSYRPVELRSLIDQAYSTRRHVTVPGVELPSPGVEPRTLDVRIVPLSNPTGTFVGISISFTDVTNTRRLQLQLEHSHVALESAYEQLQSTNEELETINEELQSTVEELETTNEELQATNEELETMNEELQSTNEELQAVNDIARQYTSELDRANSFLESVFTGLGHRVIVLDPRMRIVLWNNGSEDLWGLRSSEVLDMHFSDLDSGLPKDDLIPKIRQVLNGETRLEHVATHAVNREGKRIDLRFTVAELAGTDGKNIDGVIILAEEVARPMRAES